MAIPGIPKTTNRDRSRLFRVFDPDIVVNSTCDYFNIELVKLQNKSRQRKVVFPRQVIMYFLTEYTDMTYREIGLIFNRDHTTVIHSKDEIKNLMTVDDKVRCLVEGAKKNIIDCHI
jgi:chromosomal replication initiator protein